MAFQRSATCKRPQHQQQRSSKSNTNSKKNSTQQEKPASSSSKKWQKNTKKKKATTKAVQTLWKVKSGKGVFFTQQQQRGPNAGGAKNRKIEAKRCGAPRGGRRAPINCEKLLSTFRKVKHCKGGGGGSTVGGPTARKAATQRPTLATTAFGQQLFLVWPRPALATTYFGHDLFWPRPVLATVSPTLATVNCGHF